MKIYFILVVACLGLMFSSCHDPYAGYTYFTLYDLGLLSIGDSPDKVQVTLKRDNISEFAIDSNGFIEIYQRPLWRDIGILVSGYDYIIVYYENDRLQYWGQIDDFLNHKNPNIYNVGVESSQKLSEIIDGL